MNIETIIGNFCRKIGNYRSDDADYGIVKKVWNNGMGRLPIFRVYADKRIILINGTLYNKEDERKLLALIDALGWGELYRTRTTHYGYPYFYNHDFSLEFAKTHE